MAQQNYLETQHRIKEMVATIGDQLDPNEDWQPTLFVNGKEELYIVGFEGDFLADEDSKDRMATALAAVIKKYDGKSAFYVCSAWLRTIPAEDTDPIRDGPRIDRRRLKKGKQPSDYPIEKEIVSLVCCDEDHIDHFIADIVRYPDKGPALSDWRKVGVEGGRFIDAMVQGIKAVSSKRNSKSDSIGEQNA